MRRWHRGRGAVALVGMLLLVAVLAGCAGGDTTAPAKQVCIGTDLPTSGADGVLGKPAENGARLAVEQAKLAAGYTVELKANDDALHGQHNATQGAANVNAMSSDACILAVVGPLDDDVAAAEIPIAINAGLPLLSPLSTMPGLTQPAAATAEGLDFGALHPSGKPNTFFRLSATTDVQALADARLIGTLGAHHPFVVDDATAASVALAGFFAADVAATGGTIAGHDSLSAPTAAALQTEVARVRASGADVLFYAGAGATGGMLRAALTAGGLGALPLVGGDGIADDPAYIQTAGAAAAGTQATSPLPNLAALAASGASTFTSTYASRFSSQPTPLSALAYDAAQVELTAINAVIVSGNTPTRTNVLAQLTRTSYAGLIGPINFDANGDNVGSRVINVYTVQNLAWVPTRQFAL